MWNKDLCSCECKNPIKNVHAKKIMFGILVRVFMKLIDI